VRVQLKAKAKAEAEATGGGSAQAMDRGWGLRRDGGLGVSERLDGACGWEVRVRSGAHDAQGGHVRRALAAKVRGGGGRGGEREGRGRGALIRRGNVARPKLTSSFCV
jgi:hypothetical protein